MDGRINSRIKMMFIKARRMERNPIIPENNCSSRSPQLPPCTLLTSIFKNNNNNVHMQTDNRPSTSPLGDVYQFDNSIIPLESSSVA